MAAAAQAMLRRYAGVPAPALLYALGMFQLPAPTQSRLALTLDVSALRALIQLVSLSPVPPKVDGGEASRALRKDRVNT